MCIKLLPTTVSNNTRTKSIKTQTNITLTDEILLPTNNDIVQITSVFNISFISNLEHRSKKFRTRWDWSPLNANYHIWKK